MTAPREIDDQEELANWLGQASNENKTVVTRLRTDQKIIARVTDGIYRQPASALRELISNAWDADANEVSIHTDAPKFTRIIVRDDGRGMSHDTLARLLHSIGGSAKRTSQGADLGVTDKNNTDITPGGRPLIGKIGIGLFSVSQLGRAFRIVTKTKGTKYRLIADVVLNTYSEEASAKGDEIGDHVGGMVSLRREKTLDANAHGTDIILDSIKPAVRDLLRSDGRWKAIKELEQNSEDLDPEVLASHSKRPVYHSGWIGEPVKAGKAGDLLTVVPNYPWKKDTSASSRMRRLVEAVEGESDVKNRPDLATTLDTYLEMVWSLGLSSPVDYVDAHPFDLKKTGDTRLFWIGNEARQQAEEVNWKLGEMVRDAVARAKLAQLDTGKKYAAGPFKVIIDGLELRRPVRFNHVSAGKNAPAGPLLLVGKYVPNLSGVDESVRGGSLDIEGYLFWNGKIIPKENNGVMVRIRNTSGALFDPTFFKYQVSEQTRLRQITSELFVSKGLDPALNIDRESFNFAHPHVQLLARWTHRAVRQLTNKSKSISAEIRAGQKIEQKKKAHSSIAARAEKAWASRKRGETLPEVSFAESPAEAKKKRESGEITIDRSLVPMLAPQAVGDGALRDAKVAALLQVLAAYDLLEDMPYAEQARLVDDILAILI